MDLNESSLIVSRRQILAVAGLGMAAGAAVGASYVYEKNAAFAEAADEMGAGSGIGQGGAMGGGADTMSFDYAGEYTAAIEADGEEIEVTGESYEAADADQNAALAQNGGALTLSEVTLSKAGDDTDGDRCNFYGVNSIACAVGSESSMSLSACELSATSEGSNGIFSTDGATVLANNVLINTAAGNSRGLDATYAGTILAANMSVSTQGDHCAGIASDRGGGYISCADSSIATSGSGSPVLYSTGDIEVSNITGRASGSQLCGMEGLNTILIKDSSLVSEITRATASDPVANGCIIYQSTSGDAEATTGSSATFQVVDSSLTSAIAEGALFYITNTQVGMYLENTELSFDSDACELLCAAGNDANNWGSAGQNGATVALAAARQALAGNITVDTISQLVLYLTEGSMWTGAGTIEENASGNTVDEPLIVNVDASSTWVVTSDCEISELNVEDGGCVVDAEGKTVKIVAGSDVKVEGESSVTVTLTGEYGTSPDMSGVPTKVTDLIDRSVFDKAFDTDTSWEM